jgi:tetratricopeptide (TPR) repeat protein
MRLRTGVVWAAILSGAFASAMAQDDPHAACAAVGWVPRDVLDRPVTVRTGIGRAHEDLPGASTQVQALHDQGLAYLHSYVWIEAARSFRQALRLDPRQALTWVALSRTFTGLNDDDAARKSQAEAERLAASGDARVKLRVAARSRHLEALADLADPEKHRAYKLALHEALALEPLDVELLLLRGHAEEATAAGRGQRGNEATARYYRKVFEVSPDDFAAHHYLIHTYEGLGRIDDALVHGAAYARLAPEVPHAHHMYGHDLRRVGRLDEAIAAFLKTYELENAYYAAEKIPAGLDWHHGHNLDLLSTAYQHQGRMRLAEQHMRESHALPAMVDYREFNLKEWPGFLLSRGRNEEALAAARGLTRGQWPTTRAVGHALAGHALAALGRRDEAFAALVAADDAYREIPAKPVFGRMVTRGGVDPYLDGLRGELLLTGSAEERIEARVILKDVQARIRAVPGPDAWTEALFRLEGIARSARAAGDWELAAHTAGQMREHDPKYAGTHLALGLVAQHEGRTAEAAREMAEAVSLWRSADADLPELAEARERSRALASR